MKFVIPLMALLLIPLVGAETTFFDQEDAFIMGSSPIAPRTDSRVTSRTTGGGCRYEWNCTDWSECLPSGKQTRNCTNIGNCPDTYKTPEIEQNCTYIAPEVEGEEEGKENVTEEEGKPDKGGEGKEEIADRNKILIYSVIGLVILSTIFYLKRDYFKKLIKKIKFNISIILYISRIFII